MRTPISISAGLALAALIAVANPTSARPAAHRAPSVVGTWIVKDSAAPFPFHMYVFNADGTMQQANPDAGDPRSSDSDGKGIWVVAGDRIAGKWVEITADRASHKFTGRVEVSFSLKVDGDHYAGTESVRVYDVDGKAVDGPLASTLSGTRVTLP